MQSENKFTAIEKAFYSDGYKLGLQAAANSPTKESINLSISAMYASIDRLLTSLSEFALQQNNKIDCKKGCAFCCHQPIYLLDYEMDFLIGFAEANFSKEQQEVIQSKADTIQAGLQNLKKEEILNTKNACPFLENNSCSVYSVRPMACRIYLSTKLASCQAFYQNPEDTSNYPALLDFPIRAGRMMNEGFKSALKTKGVFARELRIDQLSFKN